MNWRKTFLLFCIGGPLLLGSGEVRELFTAAGGRVKTFDPVQADDFASRNMAGTLFDTLLQYDYTARPYRLVPSMLEAMPEVNDHFDCYRFRLRRDLYFAPDPVFPEGREARHVTARDVAFSLLRLADGRNHSPLYWMIRGKLCGLDEFHARSMCLAPGDNSCYDHLPEGIRLLGKYHFELHLTRPDPRFLYLLALPNTAVVPRCAVEKYGSSFARHPVGSGPFMIERLVRDCRIELKRNPDYRREFFPQAENPADRKRPLPLADRITFYMVNQPMTAWLLFLQGKTDLNNVDKDNSDLVAGGELPPALLRRGIRLVRVPEFEIRYVGFSFSDPRLKNSVELRRALSLAYRIQRRIDHSGGQLLIAHSPIPPGVAGYEPEFRNPWVADDPALAAELLKKAGFPGGIDPQTGGALVFTFDQPNSNSSSRQIGELTVSDFAAIGVRTTAVLNNRPRFYEKLRRQKLQLFRLSWVGDYPDAENFLQLFYSGNVGGCNRSGFSDPVFDRMYETILPMADSPERTRLYRKMARYLADRAPWVFEGFPISYQLNHGWLENWHPHDFGFGRWKYLSVDPQKREKVRSQFTPLDFRELRSGR